MSKLKTGFLAAAGIALLAALILVFGRTPDSAQSARAAADTLPAEKLAAALSERSIGDAQAPVTVYEHSSLSCPHCAHFHRDTLPRLKADYVDTGKIRIVFRDFPLNAPALTGSLLARCLPETRYYDYITLVFETQNQWLHSDDPAKILRQSATLAGLSPAEAEACLSSEALKKGLVEKMQEAGTRLKIESTPTFTIDDNIDSKILGAADYDRFKAAIDAALADKAKKP